MEDSSEMYFSSGFPQLYVDVASIEIDRLTGLVPQALLRRHIDFALLSTVHTGPFSAEPFFRLLSFLYRVLLHVVSQVSTN